MSLDRPIRVLHLRDSPWIDGPGRTILETARHIDPARVDFHIGAFAESGTASHPLIDTARAEGLNVHAIQDAPGLSREVIRQIESLIDYHRIDILHTSEFRSNALGLLSRRRFRGRLKLVATAHGWIANDMRGRVYRLLDKILLTRCDTVILVSEAMRGLLPWFVARSAHVHVLHNALVLERYGAGVSRRARRPGDAPPIILNVGRLSPEKGQELLLQAFVQVLRRAPDARLQFAGTGPLEGDLRAAAASLRVDRNVDFLGYVQDMPSLYADASLVVQSSFTEGMPNVILEAAYLGVPIVATDVGGTREVIEHGVGGWLVRPGSVERLAEALMAYLEDSERFEAMAGAARRSIAERFSFAARTEQLMQIYEGLVV